MRRHCVRKSPYDSPPCPLQQYRQHFRLCHMGTFTCTAVLSGSRRLGPIGVGGCPDGTLAAPVTFRATNSWGLALPRALQLFIACTLVTVIAASSGCASVTRSDRVDRFDGSGYNDHINRSFRGDCRCDHPSLTPRSGILRPPRIEHHIHRDFAAADRAQAGHGAGHPGPK